MAYGRPIIDSFYAWKPLHRALGALNHVFLALESWCQCHIDCEPGTSSLSWSGPVWQSKPRWYHYYSVPHQRCYIFPELGDNTACTIFWYFHYKGLAASCTRLQALGSRWMISLSTLLQSQEWLWVIASAAFSYLSSVGNHNHNHTH